MPVTCPSCGSTDGFTRSSERLPVFSQETARLVDSEVVFFLMCRRCGGRADEDVENYYNSGEE